MDFSLPFKASKYALGAVGATGTLGTAVSGKYVHDGAKAAYVQRVLKKISNSDLTLSGEKSGEFKVGNCFNTFFTGATVNMDVEQVELSTTPSKGSHPTTKLEDSTTSDESSNYSGCAHMKLEPLTSSYESFHFSSEIVVKNAKVGLALWTVLTDHLSLTFQYRLVLLEKNSDNNWNVKAGYEGKDPSASEFVLHSSPTTYHIKTPSSELGLGNIHTTVESKEWKGNWAGGNEGQEIFKEIEVYVSSSSPSCCYVLGADNPFENESSSGDGYSMLQTAYSVEDKKGKEFLGAVPPHNAQEEFKSWYAPFKGKKGTWAKNN